MSESTTIAWCDATFNPWSGCAKVSEGCRFCYAATLPPGMRRHATWGLGTERVHASESYWAQPVAWDRKAAKAGVRLKVFCASTADVFEARADLDPMRERLWRLIGETPNLTWLLLTKRPDRMAAWFRERVGGFRWPRNAWAGTTVENQAAADARVPHLLRVPAAVRFLSCEPLLGPVKLRSKISWVIAGGESGPRARPSHPAWFRSLRDQCAAAGVPFFFKQWGEHAPWLNEEHFTHGGKERHAHAWVDRDTADHGAAWLHDEDSLWSNWTGNPRGHASPPDVDGMSTLHEAVTVMGRVGKKAAGCLLDGREHKATPEPAS